MVVSQFQVTKSSESSLPVMHVLCCASSIHAIKTAHPVYLHFLSELEHLFYSTLSSMQAPLHQEMHVSAAENKLLDSRAKDARQSDQSWQQRFCCNGGISGESAQHHVLICKVLSLCMGDCRWL